MGEVKFTSFLTWSILSNFTPQMKEARNQSQIFNGKSISRNTSIISPIILFE